MKTTTKQLSRKMRINDYKKILRFYKINFTSMTNKDIKEKSEQIIASKLCNCIKKVQKIINLKKNIKIPSKSKIKEKQAISICKNSVVKKKNIKIFTFTCKKKSRLNIKKGTRKLKILKL